MPYPYLLHTEAQQEASIVVPELDAPQAEVRIVRWIAIAVAQTAKRVIGKG